MTSPIVTTAAEADKGPGVPGNTATTLASAVLDRRHELADFLRQRRAQIDPHEAGLPVSTGHRRTPGLRREELASMAGISVDWYIRLEQGRGENPSPAVLDALARALRLTDDERTHLYLLGRPDLLQTPDVPIEEVDVSLERMLGALSEDVPAYIIGRRWDILSWNRGAAEFLIDFGELKPMERNLIELTFVNEAMRGRYVDWELVARSTLANFRAAVARHLDLPEVKRLVDALAARDAQFAAWWSVHEVAEKTSGMKRFYDQDGKILLMRFDSVLSPVAPDQRLIVYTPALSAD